MVKLISAVFRPATLQDTKDALTTFGVRGLTVCEVFAPTGNRQRVEVYRGRRVATDLQPSVRVDLLAPDDEVHDLVHIIRQVAGAATTAGEGWIWVTPVDLVLRIRTGEYGADAV
jgi:nitrogen regulatory protein P-II 1